MLHETNPYIKYLKTVFENAPGGTDFIMVINADRKPIGAHKGRYNKPTTSEVALVIVGQTYEKRDIILHGRDTQLIRISEMHRAYDALQYPLMFCHGEDGSSINIPQIDPNIKAVLRKTVSASSFYSHMLMNREGQGSLIFHYRSLLNQFLTDVFAKKITFSKTIRVSYECRSMCIYEMQSSNVTARCLSWGNLWCCLPVLQVSLTICMKGRKMP